MPDPVTSRYATLEGTAELWTGPSAVPIVVVPDDVLKETSGPVPVTVEYGGRSISAWAWAQRAWDGSSHTRKKRSIPAGSVVFALSSGTAKRLGIADRIRTEQFVVTLRVPRPGTLLPVMPLVHDMPASTEVQVPTDFPGPHGRFVMVRHGVAAWVTVRARDHVRPGTVRMSAHLRTVTGPEPSVTAQTSDAVFYRPMSSGQFDDINAAEKLIQPPWRRWLRVPKRPAGRSGRPAQAIASSAVERAVRLFLGAEKQSMRVVGAHPEDVHEHAVSISESALSDLGLSSGDRVILGWVGGETEVTVLKDHTPPVVGRPEGGRFDSDGTDRFVEENPWLLGLAKNMSPHLAIRVPGTVLHTMGLPAASVVTVRRSTRSVLARNLNSLVIPVASLALAGAALNNPNWILLSLGAAATALLGLSKLRVGPRRIVRLARWKPES